jgi:hypothetical protein
MTSLPTTSRRRFLASSSNVLALTLLAGSIPLRAHDSTLRAPNSNILVLYRAGDSHSRQFAGEFALAGHLIRELSDDPVRQWRDELYTRVIHDNFTLPGLGNWADFSILRGLAAESRRFPRMAIQHEKYQTANAEWAAHHARLLLADNCLNNSGRLALMTKNLNNKSTINSGRPSLFSWII